MVESDPGTEPDTVPAKLVAPQTEGVEQTAIERIINSRTAIFVLLFGVMAVLGLPLLWISRSFSRREKVIWSIVVLIYTLVLLAITAACIWYLVRQWQEVFG